MEYSVAMATMAPSSHQRRLFTEASTVDTAVVMVSVYSNAR